MVIQKTPEGDWLGLAERKTRDRQVLAALHIGLAPISRWEQFF